MNEQFIICPHCRQEIPLTEAISHQIREELTKEFEAELRKKEKALSKKEKEVEESKKLLEKDVAEKLKLERKRIEKEEKKKAQEMFAVELKDLQQQIGEKEKKLEVAQEMELALRKERRELEESKRAFELEITRKLDQEREQIEEEVSKRALEEHRLKDLEKEKQINDMKRQIAELKRKAEVGSQQLQGEVLEFELREILTGNFPMDDIEAVPKGLRGADVLHNVNNQSGQYCGTIIWEAKRTKAWNEAWITKLKDDQRAVKAELAVLMTTAMPQDIENFGHRNGVWVTNYNSMIGLATALRMSIIEVAVTKMGTVGKEEKMEVLYNYLSGSEFKQKVEAIVEAFSSMRQELDQEKRAINRIWAKREKQIERVILNISSMYGDMQGIIGSSLPQIQSLELRALTDDTDPDVLHNKD
jgi:hypothetical protein